MLKNKIWSIPFTLALATAFICGVCQARELDDDESKRVPIGVSLLESEVAEALQEEVVLQQKLESEQAATDNEIGQERNANLDLGPQTNSSNIAAKGFFYGEASLRGIHHVCYYAVNPVTGQVTLELEDGSLWTVTSNPLCIYDWLVSDDITIYPSPWYVNSPFQLYNLQTKSYVYVNLKMGPFYDCFDYHRFIVALSWTTGELWLNDGSHWLVSDIAVFRGWNPDDTLIIGTSNDWFTSYPNVLINVNTYDSQYPKCSYLRAVCLSGPVF